MADITPSRTNIQIAEVQYSSAVSEATFTRIGAGINFINSYQNKQWYFGAKGGYGNTTETLPLEVGIREVFHFDSEIVFVGIRYGDAGSASTSEFDIEWAADGSGTWASIFSTTPKVANTAANDGEFDSLGVSTTPAGCTQPVLSKTTFDAGDRLRCKLVTKATGASDFAIVIEFRPI